MKKSAGILLYRFSGGKTEVLLAHPGGPFWKNKDLGTWSIPKGEFDDNEEPLSAAKREFLEETGIAVDGEFLELEPVKQKSGKLVMAWAVLQDIDADKISSNLFTMEWPPKSGKMQEFPEVDKAAWLDMAIAKEKIVQGQVPLLDQLETILGG